MRLPLRAYQGIVAATNMKQRMRKQIEYYHADRLNYAVVGTPNRLEYDQGFFVKNGDGSADVKPIAHLYKSQVYQLAEYLGVPEEIRRTMATLSDQDARRLGIQTAQEFLRLARPITAGAYLMPPFGSPSIAVEVMQALR